MSIENIIKNFLDIKNFIKLTLFAYELLIKRHLGLVILFIYLSYIGVSKNCTDLSSYKIGLSSNVEWLFLIIGGLTTGYINLFFQKKRADMMEISQILHCSDIEINLLIFSMKNTQRVLPRYENYEQLIQSYGTTNFPNMIVGKVGKSGEISTISIKPVTFNFIIKKRKKIEKLMNESLAKKHIESKMPFGSLIITMNNDNNSAAQFRDAISRLV